MGRPIKHAASATQDISYGNLLPDYTSSTYGGVIGQPYSAIGVYTISTSYATDANVTVSQGYINQQRSKDRFVMMDATAIGTKTTLVTLVNSTDGNLANVGPGNGLVLCYNTSNIQFYAQYITSKHVTDWNGNKYLYKVRTVATSGWANVATA